jgi:hypothetical protein
MRGENQCCNVGIEVAREIHEHYLALEGHIGDEDPADRVKDDVDQ